MSNDNPTGNNQPGGQGGATEDSASTEETIDDLLAASALRARKSFEDHVKLGQTTMRRLLDPSSVKGSLSEDAEEALGLFARDAMLAIDTWRRFLYLSAKKDE